MRLGTTSYIVEAGLVENARFLAEWVGEMQLVLYDLEDGTSNLPDAATVAALIEIGSRTGLRYSVHLPLDLRLDPEGGHDHVSLGKARKVIDCTRDLRPTAYVCHVDGRTRLSGEQTPGAWADQAVRAVEIVAAWAGDPALLAIENLEGYPLDLLDPVLARVPVSRCVDIGHLWLDGHDPLPYLHAALPRTRVVHLHGLAERDHASLAHVPAARLAPIKRALAGFDGSVIMEVFGREDFESSLIAWGD
jgi:sugar phosphate isomerase/epimerase